MSAAWPLCVDIPHVSTILKHLDAVHGKSALCGLATAFEASTLLLSSNICADQRLKFAPRRGGQRRSRAQPGEDRRHDLTISFADAVFGCSVDIDVDRLDECALRACLLTSSFLHPLAF